MLRNVVISPFSRLISVAGFTVKVNIELAAVTRMFQSCLTFSRQWDPSEDLFEY